MNPGCQIDLMEDGTCVAEMAHIHAHAGGGDKTFENLILLCTRCHTFLDKTATAGTQAMLRQWKENRNHEISERFEKQFSSFEKLRKSVTPIFERNRQIFENYGPSNGSPQNAEIHDLWESFEGELVSNNRRLELILNANRSLLPRENRYIVAEFVSHVREFEATRDKNPTWRQCLFPEKILSVFGIVEALIGLPPNLSALQNFLRYLQRRDLFISLQLDEDPCLIYYDKGEIVELMLTDRPRIQQLFWNGRFHRPHTTDVRIGSLVFFVKWLCRNDIRYKFRDLANLTEMVLKGKHKIRLCYQYLLSISEVSDMGLTEGDLVVNLHNWNGAPISQEAHEYASDIGVQLFSQNGFFRFAHRHIK